MQLVSFSVQNYRSITKAHRLGIGQSTVIIGPNNEGKSNILRAMVTALRIIATLPTRGPSFRPARHRDFYDWDTDYPVSLQASKPNGESIFLLEFELDEDDVQAFRDDVGSRINGTLPVQVSIGRREPGIRIRKKGPGGDALSSKRDLIAEFVRKRIDIEHIPAVRTADSAREIVDALLARELRSLETQPAYQKAVEAIAALQKPVLDKLSESIKRTLSDFMPEISEVAIQIPPNERYRALRRSSEVIVDDGARTALQQKGDGVQSLAALGLMRHLTESGTVQRNLLLAIEEPEAHLHPRAIHELRSVLEELSQKHRVVIATHCPLFVDRVAVSRNIIVQSNRARPAISIDEIRRVLGVRASDNLKHAQFVLLVEGNEDRQALKALLSHHSQPLADALRGGTLAIEPLSGASNLLYIGTLMREQLCDVVAFLDGDDAGRQAAERATTESVIRQGDIVYATRGGATESEFEDLLDVDCYASAIERQFNVRLGVPQFRGNKKWSARVSLIFNLQGQVWDDGVAARVKASVAKAVEDLPSRALHSQRRGPFDALVRMLTGRLNGNAVRGS